MKLLHREDVIEAGYDLPNTGLFANIAEAEMGELKFGGEWVLAEDEILVADGHEQKYLYALVAGDAAVSKKNEAGNSQQIASLGAGAAFGEMAPGLKPSPGCGGWVSSSLLSYMLKDQLAKKRGVCERVAANLNPSREGQAGRRKAARTRPAEQRSSNQAYC